LVPWPVVDVADDGIVPRGELEWADAVFSRRFRLTADPPGPDAVVGQSDDPGVSVISLFSLSSVTLQLVLSPHHLSLTYVKSCLTLTLVACTINVS
jgi:hypothetical protein